MAQPVVKYDGNYVTCYPSSNAADDGKLQLEFNMARLVTRVTSKNFCITNPAFQLKATQDPETLSPVIQIGPGQASINGMDLIITQTVQIAPPETEGEYHLAFKLARDSSNNVLGDLIYGTTKTFEGVYITYFTDKDETDKDMLFLGSVNWDGNEFTDLKEDGDKYGRIWAEDILCKLEDTKHPDVKRILLQEWLYKVPDWYFSKEGDVIYGSLEMLPGRDGSDKPGIKMEATDEDNSVLIIKAPSTDIDDPDKVLKLSGTDKGTYIDMGKSKIYQDSEDNFIFNIFSENDIQLRSYKTIKVQGDEGVEIGAGGTANSPLLTMRDHKAKFTDLNSPDLKFELNFKDENTLQQTFGKAIWQYSNTTKNVSLLQDNVNNLEIIPNGIFRKNLRVEDTISLGVEDELPQTTLSRLTWWLKENKANGKTIQFTPSTITMINPSLSDKDNSSILLSNSDNTIHTNIFDDAKIDLLNNSRNPSIIWRDGNETYNVTLEKVIGQKKLNIQGDLSLINLSATGSVSGAGLITTNGTLTFKRGSNDATIIKDNDGSSLRTSNDFYVGTSGTANLNAGNTTIKGSAKVGSSAQCVIDANGNINTSGTITGAKVFNAVYNGFGEIFRKDKNEVIEYGDIVCVRNDGLVHKVSSEQDLDTIIGICSNTIGVQMGGKDIPEAEQVEVEMVGQIWVKTNDLSLIPGQMVRALRDGTVSRTYEKSDKFGITLTDVINNKVRVVYNG